MNQSHTRIFYIDNLRIFLIVLVVLHHLAITYGAPGGWYYRENEIEDLSILPMSMFVATNQAFFMGLFFLIAAYFTHASLLKKGIGPFLKQRLMRLGVPLLVYFFLISPITIYLMIVLRDGYIDSFWNFIRDHQGFGFGPMWFVEALLYFSILYVGYYAILRKRNTRASRKFFLPGDLSILLFALIIGTGTFVVRIWLPVGWVLDPLGFQFPHFLQYISLFIIGILAVKYNWLDALSLKRGMRWLLFAQVFIFILFPLLFYLGGAVDENLDTFLGGMHWQAFAYSLWEQITGVALIIGLFGLFKAKMNTQNRIGKSLSSSAYTVYIIHPVILVVLALGLRDWSIYPPIKFLILAPLAVILCFLIALPIRKLPYARKVL